MDASSRIIVQLITQKTAHMLQGIPDFFMIRMSCEMAEYILQQDSFVVKQNCLYSILYNDY